MYICKTTKEKLNMNKENLNRLVEILSVPTHSRDESRMIAYLKGVLTEKGYEYTVDEMGNIYVTKGVTENYPLFIAHTDTVHKVNENLRIKEYIHNGQGHVDKLALTGYDQLTEQPSGCGGDDKCGVYLALEMLDKFDNVKVGFFISEEIGCIGSRFAVKNNPEFFENVGYAIQYDSPEGDSLSSTLMGKYLFESSDEFTDKVGGLIKERGITKWANHPLMEEFDFCCLNLAAGYYRYHTANEYVIVDDVQNGYDLGLELVETLGENKYVRPEKEYSWTSGWSNRRSETPTTHSQTSVMITEEDCVITADEEKRMDELNLKSLNDWSNEDWDFYEDYSDRKWYSGDTDWDDSDFGLNFLG
jgi:hypothetical protein